MTKATLTDTTDPIWYAVANCGEICGWHESELSSTDGMYRTRAMCAAAVAAHDEAAQQRMEKIRNLGY